VTLPEVASAVSCDAFAVGRSALRIAEHLGTPLPPTDTPALVRASGSRSSAHARAPLTRRASPSQLRRAVTQLPQFRGGGAPGREQPVETQALCVLRFAAACGLATGRHPRALAAAALSLAAEAAGVKLLLCDAAAALCAAADTAALRLAEIRGALVSFAQAVLPWGADVTLATLPAHLAFTLSTLAATAHDAGDAVLGELGAPARAARGKRRMGHDPPAYVRSVAERDRVADKVAAAQARIGGDAALALVAPPLPPAAAPSAVNAVEAQLALLSPPPPMPRGTKKMRPLGGNARRPRKKPAAAPAAPSDAGPVVPELDAEDAEIESLLRAGVAPVRRALSAAPHARMLTLRLADPGGERRVGWRAREPDSATRRRRRRWPRGRPSRRRRHRRRRPRPVHPHGRRD